MKILLWIFVNILILELHWKHTSRSYCTCVLFIQNFRPREILKLCTPIFDFINKNSYLPGAVCQLKPPTNIFLKNKRKGSISQQDKESKIKSNTNNKIFVRINHFSSQKGMEKITFCTSLYKKDSLLNPNDYDANHRWYNRYRERET